jgi:hypothetical protein
MHVSAEGGPRTDAKLFQDDRQRAEPGERGLEQIGPDEGRQPQPVRAVQLGQRQTHQDHAAGERHYDSVDAHIPVPLLHRSVPRTIIEHYISMN